MIDPCACRSAGILLKNPRLYSGNGRRTRPFFRALTPLAVATAVLPQTVKEFAGWHIYGQE
jgi:hypothetical protein